MSTLLENQLLACEKEALAFSGLIQAHGALLFIDRISGKFSHVSANCNAVIGQTPEHLLGQDGRAWLAQNVLAAPELPGAAGKREDFPNALITAQACLDLLVSASGSGWLLEFEPSAIDSSPDAPGLPRTSIPSPSNNAGMQQLQDSLVQGIATLSGYDRVMLYRFHADWSGEVVAEAVQGPYGSYLGLRFPASDIPANARALYAQTPYRHIPDVSSQPVALLCLPSDGDSQLLDIAWSDLRSVSPVHVQYLKNMQVAASYSVSVMVGGKLWGLVACHHHQPRQLPMPMRMHSARLAREFTVALQGFEAGQRRRAHQAALAISTQLREAASAQTLASAMTSHSDSLLRFFHAKAGFLVHDNVFTYFGVHGTQQPDGFAQTLHQWCQHHLSDTEWTCDFLPPELEVAASACNYPVRGFMSMHLRSDQSGTSFYAYWLRHEEAQEITWAGNPDKPVEQAADGQRFSPRHSFDKWVEVRRGYCAPWREETVFAARQWREQLAQWIL